MVFDVLQAIFSTLLALKCLILHPVFAHRKPQLDACSLSNLIGIESFCSLLASLLLIWNSRLQMFSANFRSRLRLRQIEVACARLPMNYV